MSVEIGLLIAIIGCFIGLAGWLSSRDKKLSTDSEWKGTVNTKLDLAIGIRQDHEELRVRVTKNEKHSAGMQHDIDNLRHDVNNLTKQMHQLTVGGGITHED
jgi:SMC interacting uncharacterized protein involved in chromosome segregation